MLVSRMLLHLIFILSTSCKIWDMLGCIDLAEMGNTTRERNQLRD